MGIRRQSVPKLRTFRNGSRGGTDRRPFLPCRIHGDLARTGGSGSPERRPPVLGCGPMSPSPSMDPTTFTADLRTQFDAFLDEHRADLHACLDGMTEPEARASLVPSQTTLLGLLKHATFVEKVWFDEAITGRSRQEIGIPATPDESFVLEE